MSELGQSQRMLIINAIIKTLGERHPHTKIGQGNPAPT
jgi:hypothetical protein